MAAELFPHIGVPLLVFEKRDPFALLGLCRGDALRRYGSRFSSSSSAFTSGML